VLLETAAVDYAASLAGTERLQMRSWHVTFLARAKTGPFRVDGEALRGAGGTVAARVTLHDEGGGGRMATSASAAFDIL
jgi:acyl-coenzyme A thioesterase PaaI-like protein